MAFGETFHTFFVFKDQEEYKLCTHPHPQPPFLTYTHLSKLQVILLSVFWFDSRYSWQLF